MPALGLLNAPNDTVNDPNDAATLQACRDACGVVQGEWVFNTQDGIPLYTEFIVKAPDLDRIRATIRRQLLSVTGGVDLVLNDAGDLAIVNGELVWGTIEPIVEADVSAEFIAAERRIAVSFVAYTAAGKAIRDTVEIRP